MNKDFKEAVDRFWTLASDIAEGGLGTESKIDLMTAADDALLARDTMKEAEYDDVGKHIDQICGFLGDQKILMLGQPVRKSTGGMTYRPLTIKRFDM